MPDDTGPWTKYQKNQPGPWTQYQKPEAPQAGATDKPKAEPETSKVTALWEGLKQGLGDMPVGAGQLAAHGAKAVGIPGGEMAQKWLDQMASERETSYQANPDVKAHGIMAGLGRIGANVAETAPLMAAGAGALGPLARGASLAARVGTGAAQGGAAAAAMPVTSGDYGEEKLKQLGFGMGIGGAIPAVGSALAPAMSNVAQYASNVTKAFPALRGFLSGAEERTTDGFNRAVVTQALEPIGGTVPKTMKAGNGLISHMLDKYDDAYNKIKPNISLNNYMGQSAWRTYQPQIDQIAVDLVPELEKTFRSFLTKFVESRFDSNGIMTGGDFLAARRTLSERARALYGNGVDKDDLANAYQSVRSLLGDAADKQNPGVGPELKRIDQGYSMVARITKAASGRDASGKFTPSDLLGALRSQETDNQFAAGKAMANGTLQGYAQLGLKQLAGAKLGAMDIAHAFGTLQGLGAMGKAAALAPPQAIGRGLKATAPYTSPVAGQQLEEGRRSYLRPRQRDYFEERGYRVGRGTDER